MPQFLPSDGPAHYQKFSRQHQQQDREQSADPLDAQHSFQQLAYDQPLDKIGEGLVVNLAVAAGAELERHYLRTLFDAY